MATRQARAGFTPRLLLTVIVVHLLAYASSHAAWWFVQAIWPHMKGVDAGAEDLVSNFVPYAVGSFTQLWPLHLMLAVVQFAAYRADRKMWAAWTVLTAFALNFAFAGFVAWSILR